MISQVPEDEWPGPEDNSSVFCMTEIARNCE